MSEQVRRFMAPTNDTCDMDSYQLVVLAADHDAAVQELRADAREWKAKAEEALNDWRKACQLNGDAAEREFKLKAEAEALRAENERLSNLADTGAGIASAMGEINTRLRAELEDARAFLRVNQERLSTISAHSMTRPADWCSTFKTEIRSGIQQIDSFLTATDLGLKAK